MGVLGATNRPGPRLSRTSSRSNPGSPSAAQAGTNDLFGYKPPELPPALHRDVFKFLHSLDMTHPLKDPRRDLCNGFLMAEILSRFYPVSTKSRSSSSSHCCLQEVLDSRPVGAVCSCCIMQ
jgi:hypothetical protein